MNKCKKAEMKPSQCCKMEAYEQLYDKLSKN